MMDDRTTKDLLVQVSRIKAMLEQHIADSAYYRRRLDEHLTHHPTNQKLWGLMLGVGWMATLGVSLIALVG
tara:strand:- start:357 stop:569 length:213 start_codon:yes stop_codon:yes gene_type:complete